MHIQTSSIQTFAGDIKLAHSVFALPFAVVGLILSRSGLPSLSQSFLLLVAMVSARSFAMGINRLLDADIDAKNERTSQRAIPSGRLSVRDGWWMTFFAGGVFIVASFALSPLCGKLSFPLLLILAFYSKMKRVSWLTHLYLGFCLAMAPVAASIALTGDVNSQTILVGMAVMFWTAGFDILYSLQDRTFDRQHGLYSAPVRFGVAGALWLSRVLFILMVILLVIAGRMHGAGVAWYLGTIVVSVLLGWEHWIVRDTAEKVDGRIIDKAFFTANAWVSAVFCLAVLMDQVLRA